MFDLLRRSPTIVRKPHLRIRKFHLLTPSASNQVAIMPRNIHPPNLRLFPVTRTVLFTRSTRFPALIRRVAPLPYPRNLFRSTPPSHLPLPGRVAFSQREVHRRMRSVLPTAAPSSASTRNRVSTLRQKHQATNRVTCLPLQSHLPLGFHLDLWDTPLPSNSAIVNLHLPTPNRAFTLRQKQQATYRVTCLLARCRPPSTFPSPLRAT